MVLIAWAGFALLALLWTGGALAASALAGWMAEALASGTAIDAGRQLATVPLPPWLAVWVDPAWLQAAQSALAWALEAGQGALPFLGAAAGWLVPLVWVVWGFGFVLLLAGAGGTHLLLRRLRRKRPMA